MSGPESILSQLSSDATPTVRRRAVEVLRSFVERGGDGAELMDYLKWHRFLFGSSARRWDATSETYRRVTVAAALDTVEEKRDTARRDAAEAVAALLEFYDAPETSIEWHAVYVGPRAEGWTIESRSQFREALRSVLHHIENDPALGRPLRDKLKAKPTTRREPERYLREKFGLGRDSARALLAALKRK